ncbi:uncharacterized protein BP01DRAFT_357216 [Aspergillus saccharolyticus JOP 1030-1]|uniref:Uncharacterized protein n=1 Tax=Aspergillus saccharolyticus JOP 1030-1 TaxID=1450539 RepID=A0A318ZE23_9EURO|nr:hypothetical protein BP01DRAFT_357216 [Aspergillus saccharolyticus JOP 1030-1]PYH44867.1 hypothetical protein BP01DRAFT_357216 [Aspergillus saccharolyticus JOP 1030-1]
MHSRRFPGPPSTRLAPPPPLYSWSDEREKKKSREKRVKRTARKRKEKNEEKRKDGDWHEMDWKVNALHTGGDNRDGPSIPSLSPWRHPPTFDGLVDYA